MPVLIGTSGWQYRSWRERFYPAEVAQARWLEFYSERFQTVEVNNAFYRLPEATTFASWRERTPDDFVVGVKASRYLTHIKRLRDPEEPVVRFLDRARSLGPKLGPVLLQLPPTLRADRTLLDDVLTLFPRDVRVAVEFRHESWFNEATQDVLRAHDAAFCLADSPHRITPRWRTATWGYLRMHEGVAPPRPCYDDGPLSAWAEYLAGGFADPDDVFVFFNNDPEGCAVRDAARFAGALRAVGLHPTRTPEPGSMRVGALT